MRILTIALILMLPATAHAGRIASAITPGERCPKLSNPIECRDRSESERTNHGSDREADEAMHEVYAGGERYIDRLQDRECERLRLLYLGRHPVGTPDSLRDERGCDRWREDAEYHSGALTRERGPHAPLDALLKLLIGLWA